MARILALNRNDFEQTLKRKFEKETNSDKNVCEQDIPNGVHFRCQYHPSS